MDHGKRAQTMYLVRTDGAGLPGRGNEFEAWWAVLGNLLKAQKGFQLAILGNSWGYPGRYSAVARWDNRDSFLAFFKSDAVVQRVAA